MRALTANFTWRRGRISYAQSGEDIIVDNILAWVGISKPTYLDIGAYHPWVLSNTYLFYKKGGHGVCVEPDPELYKTIRKARKRDMVLNIGVGDPQKAKEAVFQRLSLRTLSTFQIGAARRRLEYYPNAKVDETMKVPIVSINEIIEEHLAPWPNFVSIDVEGGERDIIETLDFGRFKPEVFCIETLEYLGGKRLRKEREIIEIMNKNGYATFAETFLNTIFVSEGVLKTIEYTPG